MHADTLEQLTLIKCFLRDISDDDRASLYDKVMEFLERKKDLDEKVDWLRHIEMFYSSGKWTFLCTRCLLYTSDAADE